MILGRTLSIYFSNRFLKAILGLFLFAAVLCVLLVACTNVANLVMARGLDRTHELSVRTAMGAGHGRLLRQLLAENALLALAARAVGDPPRRAAPVEEAARALRPEPRHPLVDRRPTEAEGPRDLLDRFSLVDATNELETKLGRSLGVSMKQHPGSPRRLEAW